MQHMLPIGAADCCGFVCTAPQALVAVWCRLIGVVFGTPQTQPASGTAAQHQK
jgi:hypothetical protein